VNPHLVFYRGRRFYADSTKFKRATGWTPAVALAHGLAETVGFYRRHLHRYLEEEVRV